MKLFGKETFESWKVEMCWPEVGLPENEEQRGDMGDRFIVGVLCFIAGAASMAAVFLG